MKCFLFSFVISISFFSNAQSNIDVLNYKYEIELSDNYDTIKGKATITAVLLDNSGSVAFDLAGRNSDNKGMQAIVYSNNSLDSFSYDQSVEKIHVLFHHSRTGETKTFIIEYKGIPADGLIISRSMFGKRTFFSDNWPDRAHNWIPCNDNPADKASVEFIVTAPAHYKVVSNGVLVEEKEVGDNRKLTHWKEDTPLPTKIMVIGVADFAVDTAGIVYGIPVTSWVFPENKREGFRYYAQAKDVLTWLIDYIGPFPYKKLANIQSKTIFGGMENAGAIFYNENYIATGQMDERLIAHEISHQWFGDMITEKNFSHLWLSEGFATYLPSIFLESKYGKDRIIKELKEDRGQVIAFAKTSHLPVVDSLTPYMQLLNANSYQKGGWILHMLRRELGDSAFHTIIRSFYQTYTGKNADTHDFEKICEQVSGKNLETFFQQWLYSPGYPDLDIKWKYDAQTKNLLVTIDQLQKNMFRFPLEISLETVSGAPQLKTLFITKQNQQFSIHSDEKITRIQADPNISLLFEATVSEAK